MKKYYIVEIILTLFFFSCENQEQISLKKSINNLINTNDNIKYVVVIPNTGCEGCINTAEVFMKNNINKDSIFFILTKINSLKLLKFHLGFDPSQHNNILIDSTNNYFIDSENTIYPCIVYLNNGDIVKYEFQSPNNTSALNNLQFLL